ncbi:hypothetical protein AB0J09_53100, partial [Nonomuraea sp. NPDC049784]
MNPLRRWTTRIQLIAVAAACALAATVPGSAAAHAACRPALAGFTLAQAEVEPGGTVAGTVTLTCAAGRRGVLVALSTTSGAIGLPSGVTVPAGSTRGTAVITGRAVPAPTTATITASYGSGVQRQTITVVPAATPAPAPSPSELPKLRSGSVSPPVITGGDGAVQTITLDRPAPAGGVVVSLSYDLIYGASTGRRAVVPAGATSVTFPFRIGAPKQETLARLYAQVPGSPLAPIAEVRILPADPAIRAVTALEFSAPAALVGATVTGTVTLKEPAPAGGITVALWSNTSYGPNVNVPPYVTVPAGSVSASFPVRVNEAATASVVTPSADLGTSLVTQEFVVVPGTFSLSGGGGLQPGETVRGAVGIGSAP